MEREKFRALLSPHTAVGQYMRHIEGEIHENLSRKEFVERWRPMIESHRAQIGTCFLSVILRTQGRRPEAFREALLCLSAQTDRDFEILLIGHKLDQKQRAFVESVLDEQAPEFRKQIRFLPFDEGNATVPLNYGYAQANGEYVMVFDDDDLVGEDCVEQYRLQAQKTPGTVLFRYTVSQKWCVSDPETGALRALEPPENTYCYDYDLLEQVYLNHCPPIGLAFPAYAFRDLGIIYDEQLTTTEDWDFLLRVVQYCGIATIGTVGAVYRRWTNAESSATVHQQDEWKKNYRLIQEKSNQSPMLLPPGYAMRISYIAQNYGIEPWSAMEGHRRRMIDLEQEIDSAREYMRKCEADIAQLREYAGRLEQNQNSGDAQKLQADIAELREYAAKLERERGDLLAYVQSLETAVAAAQEKQYIAKLEADITEMREYIAVLETAAAAKEEKQYISKLEADIAELKEYTAALEGRFHERDKSPGIRRHAQTIFKKENERK